MRLTNCSLTSSKETSWHIATRVKARLETADVKVRGVSVAEKKKDGRLERAGVSGYNKPKKTPNHPTKSHVVVAKEGDQIKTIRFGQQGVSGDKKPTARQKSFKARHAKNIKKGKMSAAYWADKVKW